MKRRLFLTYTVLLVVGFMIVGFFTNSFVKDNYEEDLNITLASNLNLLKLNLERDLPGGDLSRIDMEYISEDVSQALDVRVTMIDSEGEVLVDSEVSREDLPEVENHRSRPEFKNALSGERGRDIRTSATLDIDYLYMAVPIENNGSIIGALRLAYPMLRISTINRAFLENIILSILIAFGISLYMGYRYSKKISLPIQNIAASARLIAKGDFNQKVRVETGDELQDLGHAFNSMTERLSSTIGELENQHLKIRSILSSISEGLVAVDNENRIMLINYSGRDLLGITETEVHSKQLEGLIGNPVLREAVGKILEEGNLGLREVVLEEPEHMVLKFSYDKIHSDSGMREMIGKIMVVRDITEMRKLEKMRTDFVANVSHELKTPLTSISGFVETLKGGAVNDDKVRDRFLDIIEMESSRLSRLLDDLLVLSNIETSQIGMSRKSEIKVKKTVVEVFEMVEKAADGKSINLKSEIPDDLPNLYGNGDWFKQMVLNLVDNAVKYTPENGTVGVSAYRLDSDVFIKVKDNGMGISQEDVSRLFERFYRVDKARSRDIGGTGLGLAIVKHIVLAFGGDIKVRSDEGKGSEFIVRIPIDRARASDSNE